MIKVPAVRAQQTVVLIVLVEGNEPPRKAARRLGGTCVFVCNKYDPR